MPSRLMPTLQSNLGGDQERACHLMARSADNGKPQATGFLHHIDYFVWKSQVLDASPTEYMRTLYDGIRGQCLGGNTTCARRGAICNDLRAWRRMANHIRSVVCWRSPNPASDRILPHCVEATSKSARPAQHCNRLHRTIAKTLSNKRSSRDQPDPLTNTTLLRNSLNATYHVCVVAQTSGSAMRPSRNAHCRASFKLRNLSPGVEHTQLVF